MVLFGCDFRKHGNLLHHGTVAGRMDPIPSGTADTTGTAGTVGTGTVGTGNAGTVGAGNAGTVGTGNAGTVGTGNAGTTVRTGSTFSGVFDEPCRVLQILQDKDMGADSVIELHCGQRS